MADFTVPERGEDSPTRPGDQPTVPTQTPTRVGPAPNLKVGRYVLLELLGTGGMGEVYAAFDPTLDRKVALKLLYPSLEQTSREQMLAEARALARLNHPNVVAVHEVGEEGGRAYLALEYADGETLDRWLKTKPRTWREVLEVFLEAGRGLHAAHLAGLVHRDFKPSNVILRNDGRVQLLDFGIARNTTLKPPSTASGALTTVAGTPGFMSPEQLMGYGLDARSDQFSFCVALYEALNGTLPFGSACDEGQLLRIQKQQYALPTTKTDLPRALLPLLKRGMQEQPVHRFASMGELMRQLKFRLPADRRMLLLIAALSLIASASVGAAVLKPRSGVACAPKQVEIAEQWKQTERAKTKDQLGADLDGVLLQMDTWLEGLSSTAQRVCADFAAGAPGEQLLREQQCLSERQREFLQAATALTEGSSEARQLLDEAAPPEACLSTDVATAFDVYQQLAPARQAVALANRAWLDGAWLEALTLADAAEKQARSHASPELRSTALRLKGLAFERLGELKLAEETLHLAARAAEGATDESRAAAWVSLARVVGVRQGRLDDGMLWAAYASDQAVRFPQRKELHATLQLAKLRMSPEPDALPKLDALDALLGPNHALHPVVLAERARKVSDFEQAYEAALTALGQAREPVVPTLLGVADALEQLGPQPRSAQRLLELSEIRLASQPRAALVRLRLAQVAREAGAVEPARAIAARVLTQSEADPSARATAELARLELGICQLTLGNTAEALPLLAAARVALEGKQSTDALWPARAARAQFWEALALSRAKKKPEGRAQLQKAIAAANLAGVERQAALEAQRELAQKK